MQLLRKQVLNKNLNNKVFSLFQQQRDIQVNLTNGKLCLNIEFPNDKTKLFFLDNNFTFANLKSLVQVEHPNYSIDFDFQQAKSKKMQFDEDSIITQFIEEKQQGEVDIIIDDIQYQLKNIGNYPLNQQIENLWNQNGDDQYIKIYKQCLQNQLKSSHAGSITHLVKKFLDETSKVGQNKQLTDKEVDNIFKECIKEFSDPVKQKIENLTQRKNELQSELQKLEQEKSKIENLAEKRIRLYIKLILLISMIHIISFYYMIFHIEWLGWDIIEPITYSVGVFSLLLGMRFFMKYRKNRQFETMINIWRHKLINKNRNIRDRYADLGQNTMRKQEMIQNVQTRIDIYKNRKNYTQFTNQNITE